MRAASCAAAKRSASLPTSPMESNYAIARPHLSLRLLQPPNPCFYFETTCAVSLATQIGFAAEYGNNGENLVSRLTHSCGQPASATTVGSTAFAAANYSPALVPWKGTSVRHFEGQRQPGRAW